MHKPEEDEGEDDERGRKDREDGRQQRGEESVVLPGVPVGLAQVAGEEPVVAAVGLVRDVEEVAEKGNRADKDIQAEIDHHAGERDIRDAANPGGEYEDKRGDAGQRIADARDESDEAVETEADGRAGDAEDVVEKMGEEVEIGVGEKSLAAGAEAGAQRRNHFGLGAVGHRCRGGSGALRRGSGRARTRARDCAANATIGSVVADIVQRQNA